MQFVIYKSFQILYVCFCFDWLRKMWNITAHMVFPVCRGEKTLLGCVYCMFSVFLLHTQIILTFSLMVPAWLSWNGWNWNKAGLLKIQAKAWIWSKLQINLDWTTAGSVTLCDSHTFCAQVEGTGYRRTVPSLQSNPHAVLLNVCSFMMGMC